VKPFSAEDITDHLARVLETACPGVWLSILPNDDDDDSIYYHTGQEWADMLPCIMVIGLIRFQKGKIRIMK
jgi:hypothetical protein